MGKLVSIHDYGPGNWFSPEEFMCRCCGLENTQPTLLRPLNELRDLVGHPIHVISGTRCRDHNRAVGGAPRSYHLRGMAADIVSRKLNPGQLRVMALKVPAFRNGGIGEYPSWIHVDVRSLRARW